jgi:hypothetical protein
MSSITIHAIDSDLDRRLSDEARRRKRSKNQLVKELLAHALGLPGEYGGGQDYAEFLGLWTSEECVAFASSQADNEAVDRGDWL